MLIFRYLTQYKYVLSKELQGHGLQIRGVRKKLKNVQIGDAEFAFLAENQTGIASSMFHDKFYY